MDKFNTLLLLENITNGYFSERCQQFGHYGIRIIHPDLIDRYFSDYKITDKVIGIDIHRNMLNKDGYVVGVIVEGNVIIYPTSMSYFPYAKIAYIILDIETHLPDAIIKLTA